MNSLANGKIIHNSKFEEIYVSPSPGDAGGSIGSACILINKYNKFVKVDNYSYLGPEYSNKYILKIINQKKLEHKSVILNLLNTMNYILLLQINKLKKNYWLV